MDQHMDAAGGLAGALAALLARQRASFMAAPRPSAQERAGHLRQLEAAIKKSQDAIADALGTILATGPGPKRCFRKSSRPWPPAHSRAGTWRAGCARNGAPSGSISNLQ